MNFKGYKKIEINGNYYLTKGPGLTLMDKIENILVSDFIQSCVKHLKIIDLIKLQDDETLGEAFILYVDHWQSPNPAINQSEKETTFKVMALINIELEERGYNFD